MSEKEIQSVIRKLLPKSEGNIGHIRKISGGQNNDVYSFKVYSGCYKEDLILKVYKTKFTQRTAANEYKTLLDLESKGFNSAPTVIKFEDANPTSPHAYFLMERVEGVHLKKYLAHGTAQNVQIAIGKLVSLIRQLNFLGYNHGDAHQRNFVFNGDRMFLLDWQGASKSDYHQFKDVANLFYTLWKSFGMTDILGKRGSAISEQFLKEYLRTEKPSLSSLNQYLMKAGVPALQDMKDEINPVKFTKWNGNKYFLVMPFVMLYSTLRYIEYKKFIAKFRINNFYD